MGGDRPYRFRRRMEPGDEPGGRRLLRVAAAKRHCRALCQRYTDDGGGTPPARQGGAGQWWLADHRSGAVWQRLPSCAMAMPAKEEGADTPFGAFFRRESATILDTWHTLGMRGTGSADYTVTDLYVPEHLTVPVAPLQNPPPGFEGPLFRMWPWTAILGEATVSVGVAAAAVDAAVQLCKTKTPAYNATPLREQQLAQFQMGKAKARVEASRDTLYRAA